MDGFSSEDKHCTPLNRTFDIPLFHLISLRLTFSEMSRFIRGRVPQGHGDLYILHKSILELALGSLATLLNEIIDVLLYRHIVLRQQWALACPVLLPL